jgi:hypothetical protein
MQDAARQQAAAVILLPVRSAVSKSIVGEQSSKSLCSRRQSTTVSGGLCAKDMTRHE